MSEWISVTDRLPGLTGGEAGLPPIISDDVLCFWPDDMQSVSRYNGENDTWYELDIDGSGSPVGGEPTHWMPLPEPPPQT